MEGKIQTEMVTLKENIQKMETDIVTYSDLDKLRTDAEIKRTELEGQKAELGERSQMAEEMLKEITEKADNVKVTRITF